MSDDAPRLGALASVFVAAGMRVDAAICGDRPNVAELEVVRALVPEFHAGVIEHDQDDLDPATRDLRLARTLSANRACLALSDLALVSVKRSNWSEAASGFGDTMECHASSVGEARAQFESVTANAELAADFRAMRLAEIAAKRDETRSSVTSPP